MVGCTEPVIAPPPLEEVAAPRARRLTNVEYSNTVWDLFGVRINPGALPEETRIGLFTNDANARVPTDLRTEAYAEAARDIARTVAEISPEIRRRLLRRPPQQPETQLPLEVLLQGPQFLYRLESQPLDGYGIATRMSYFLWRSAPDDALLDAAPRLTEAAVRTQQARRMLADPRARRAVRQLFEDWLALSRVATAQRSTLTYPGLTAELRHDMVEALWRRLERLVFEEDLPLASALTDQRSFATPALAELYGIPSAGPGVREYASIFNRRGLLTEPAVLMASSPSGEASVVQRGKFLLERLLCTDLPPPPASLDISLANPVAGESQRDQLRRHREDDACSYCHDLMDPLGLGLDPYDGIGAFAQLDAHGNRLRSDGVLSGTGFANTEELSRLISKSEDFQHCLIETPLRYAMGGPAPAMQARLQAEFQDGVRLRALMISIVADQGFLNAEAQP